MNINAGDKAQVVTKEKVFMKTNPFEEFNSMQNVVRKVVIQDELSPIENAISSVDISEAGDGSVMAYLTTDDQVTFDTVASSGFDEVTLEEIEKANGTMYIQGNGKIYAPENSLELGYYM